MISSLNKNININSQTLKEHSKASEKYVDVTFKLSWGNWSGWIPIVYRRTGLNLKTDEEISNHISNIYTQMDSLSPDKWLENEMDFWEKEKSKAKTTREFFDVLSQCGWKCREHELPKNPNFARRIQDLKEFGYTLATDTTRFCEVCKSNKTHINLLPVKRVIIAGNGYETWSQDLRKRILKILKNYDVYEGKVGQHLLPDHKFSEIRWDEDTKSENPDTMTEAEIREKFQLLSNQRNQQKREACRLCSQINKRQFPFGIKYFYEGEEDWDPTIPVKGKLAEQGCKGCGWYDMERWRQELLKDLNKNE